MTHLLKECVRYLNNKIRPVPDQAVVHPFEKKLLGSFDVNLEEMNLVFLLQ
jgi:hypothetical protein